MVAHLLVDVEVGGGRGIKAREQLVDDDQQLHLARLIDELLFHLQLEAFDLADRLFCRLAKPVGQHLGVDRVFAQVVGVARAGGLALGVGHAGRVAGDDGALALEFGLGKQLVELAGLKNAAGHQHGVAVPVHQA